ncbi:MAG TPA: glycerophosphodiester phosphodiesterase [Casimicrobiaceae bacterium]|nr:glycerophosphodiester phosphodiesterase [Casimicrobiaceae bacterium]
MKPILAAAALALAFTGDAHAFDIQGHRGARGYAPENTLAAFKRALELGVTTIETDVGVSKDDVVVIAHDRRLNPAFTRDADGRWIAAPGSTIRSLTAAELMRYDVGRLNPESSYAKQWPQQVAADAQRIPQLSELFALVRTHPKRVSLNIETKLSPLAPDDTVTPAAFARLLVDEVRATDFTDRVTIQSFDWRTLVEAKRLAPEIRTACLTTEGGNGDTVKADASGRSPWHAGLSLSDAGSVAKLVKAARCDIWSPFWRNVTADRVREAKALGLQVIPWTVNEPADIEAMLDLPIDGLISDYPDRVAKLVATKGIAKQ